MVNLRALKFAAVVFGFLLVALVAGTVIRRLTWMLTWGITMAMVLGVAYAAYEIWSGWNAADDERERRTRETPLDESREYESVDEAKGAYANDALSDEEFEAELEQLVDSNPRELERERE